MQAFLLSHSFSSRLDGNIQDLARQYYIDCQASVRELADLLNANTELVCALAKAFSCVVNKCVCMHEYIHTYIYGYLDIGNVVIEQKIKLCI